LWWVAAAREAHGQSKASALDAPVNLMMCDVSIASAPYGIADAADGVRS
jgi:hypothetical protein